MNLILLPALCVWLLWRPTRGVANQSYNKTAVHFLPFRLQGRLLHRASSDDPGKGVRWVCPLNDYFCTYLQVSSTQNFWVPHPTQYPTQLFLNVLFQTLQCSWGIDDWTQVPEPCPALPHETKGQTGNFGGFQVKTSHDSSRNWRSKPGYVYPPPHCFNQDLIN